MHHTHYDRLKRAVPIAELFELPVLIFGFFTLEFRLFVGFGQGLMDGIIFDGKWFGFHKSALLSQAEFLLFVIL